MTFIFSLGVIAWVIFLIAFWRWILSFLIPPYSLKKNESEVPHSVPPYLAGILTAGDVGLGDYLAFLAYHYPDSFSPEKLHSVSVRPEEWESFRGRLFQEAENGGYLRPRSEVRKTLKHFFLGATPLLVFGTILLLFRYSLFSSLPDWVFHATWILSIFTILSLLTSLLTLRRTPLTRKGRGARRAIEGYREYASVVEIPHRRWETWNDLTSLDGGVYLFSHPRVQQFLKKEIEVSLPRFPLGVGEGIFVLLLPREVPHFSDLFLDL